MNAAHPMRLEPATLNALFQYAMVLCRQRDDAYDLLQAALEKYLIEIKRGSNTIDHPEAFVRTMIRNRFIDSQRYRQRWQNQPFEESATYDISPSCLEQLAIDRDSLQRVWAVLSPQDRDILYHWAVLGYSTDEACQQLDLPRGTFLSRIHRLRTKLSEQQDADEPSSGRSA